MNWHELVPSYIANRQIAWERQTMVARVKASGVTYTEIARFLGVSVERVRQLCRRGQKLASMSPIEAYLNQPPLYEEPHHHR